MEKKVAKKAAAKKKAVELTEIELKSPWTTVATPPVKKRASKSAPKAAAAAAEALSEPGAIATGSAKAKKKLSVPGAVATGAVKKTAKKVTKKAFLDMTAEIAAAEPKVELSPVFKALAEPTLPELGRENRARLMMQTPAQLYFYWSVKENPYRLLRNAFGDDTGSYTLVLKLTELRRGIEEIHPVEAEGNWWFAVEPDGKYEAEIGFYAPNRPYFRIIYSNTIETPRRSPSRRAATESDWKVSANKFAEVLDVAGFTQDAFDVAMAGDDQEAAENTTHIAFSHFIGTSGYDLGGIAAEDIRYSLTAFAAGLKIEDLRSRISPALFAILQANAGNIAADKAMSALTEYFDIDEADFTEHQHGPAVYGASFVNFPRTLTTRGVAPVSSHSFR